MPVINGVYLKDFTALPGAVADANIIPIAISGDNVAYRTTVAGIVTDARITAKLLTGLSVTGGAVVAADTILEAFGKVQNQINGKQGTITLTTTGTSGAATLVSNTLNIPTYTDAFVGTVTSVGLSSATSGVTIGSTPITTSGTITIAIATATSLLNGLLSSTDWTTFNNKQGTITLTTTGTSGAATFSANTLNIPQYADAYVGTVTSVAALTLGTTGTDLSSTVANGTTTPVITLQVPTASASNRGALSSADWTTFNGKQATITLTTTGTSGAATFSSNTLNIPNYADSFVGTVTSVAAITLGTTGSDLSSTVANGTTTPVITLQVPTASASNRGALSSADWSTFNGKQGTITLTTTGTSGAATFISNTLNIPNYADGGVLSLSAIGGTANANAATITGTVLNLQPASASFGGVVTTGTQTFAGTKTLNNDIYVIGGAQVYGLSAIGEYDGSAQIPPGYGGNYALTLGSGLTSNGLSLYATGAALLTSTATATAFIPSGATVPTNGMYLSAANTLNFATNTTNRLSIASTGAATFQSVNAKVNTGGWHLLIQDNTSMAAGVGGGISFNGYKTGTSAQGVYAGINGYKTNGTAGNELGGFNVWTSNGTNLVKQLDITDTGAATFSSGISVGGATATTGGIQFPATQVAIASANNLDDYEEGDWTVGITFGGASVGVTASINAGKYTKIGRQVTVTGALVLTNKGSSVGDAAITGLPFTIGNANGFYQAASFRNNNISFADQFVGYGAISDTTIQLNEMTNAGVLTSIDNTNFANTSSMLFSLTYFV